LKSLLNIFIFLIFLLLGLTIITGCNRPAETSEIEIKILLVDNSDRSPEMKYVLKAYESVLQEEGVPYQVVSPSFLLGQNVSEIAGKNPAIIFADGICQVLSLDLKFWLKEYLSDGGKVAMIYDAGSKNSNGVFNKNQLLADIIGIEYIPFDRSKGTPYTMGSVSFIDKAAADYFQIPPGKTDKENSLFAYGYGIAQYPLSGVQIPKQDQNLAAIYAYGTTLNNHKVPVLISSKFRRGELLFVNLPLGYLKAHSDDLPLRVVLRTFLFKIVRLPHLANVPQGKGGLVINLHVDGSADLDLMPTLFKSGYFRRDILSSIHITAGDFRDVPGDSLGFDACGRGKSFIDSLAGYGVIGSHGGWGHNWFADSVEQQAFGRAKITKYVKQNNDCLSSLVGYSISEYSAPAGVHPQPLMAEILEELGIKYYYYTGDMGSAPNRTFYDGQSVSDNLIAFPPLFLENTAAFNEMRKACLDKKRVGQWLAELTEYVIDNKTIRLFYSHPYDLPDYAEEYKQFLKAAADAQLNNRLNILPMSYFGRFINRFLKTEYKFIKYGNTLIVRLNNPESLKDISVAIPSAEYLKPHIEDVDIYEDNEYYYCVIKSKKYEQDINFTRRNTD